jgi:FkbM family methyltransferase
VSQLGQDVLALSYSGTHKPGFFVEFGATDGVELSNTYILEKDFGWKGILCEPGSNWHNALKANRDSVIDFRCVFSSSGESLDFSESSVGELSTLKEFTDSDSHSRSISRIYKVTTVSLTDLLSEHQAPRFIEFISIDTEGSEYEILRDFDFETYQFGLICVEHNFTENRGRIFDLLTDKGYRRVYEEFSKWDDWYVPSVQGS